jgi:hypothetical protein
MAKAAPARKVTPAPAPIAAPERKHIDLDITPSPEAGTGLTLHQQARSLVVVDKESHRNALEFVRAGKQLRRKIVEHWQRIKRNVDDLKKNLLDLERRDLEPVDLAIAEAERIALVFSQAEERRVREAEDADRRRREEQARTDRENQLAEQERKALELEADSPNLSNREQIFVEAIAARPVGVNQAVATAAADRAGYKDPAGASQRLLATPKIMDAIANKRAARELREQQAATRQQPLDVAPAGKFESQTARVAGMRTVTHYGCEEEIDLERFRAALLAGEIPIESVAPHMPTLNKAANDLKEAFEAAYPGCRLKKKTGLAG